METKTLPAKLELRRYFLGRYHPGAQAAIGVSDEPRPRVLDCCQGDGLIWGELQKEFAVAYVGVDLKAKKGRLKIDSARLLDQPGWDFDVIDVDTYGSPWKHWFAILKYAKKSVTVFLTVGLVSRGAFRPAADGDTMRVLGLDVLWEKCKAKGVTPPQSLSGLVRDKLGLDACIAAALDSGFTISDFMESENPGGHARYFGVRLERWGAAKIPERVVAESENFAHGVANGVAKAVDTGAEILENSTGGASLSGSSAGN